MNEITTAQALEWFENRNVPMPGARAMYNKAIAALRAQLEAESRDNRMPWISADNPPKESRQKGGAQIPFLIYTEKYGIDIGNYDPRLQIWTVTGYYEVKPTHWMPLPEPPKGGNADDR